jgi:hypothetical protein
MTAPHTIDPARLLGQALGDASPDLMRTLLATVINALLSADADAVCGAEYGQASPDRVTQRNGYRHRELDTRVVTVDVAIPKLRQGSYFPDWLLERRKRGRGGAGVGGGDLLPVCAGGYTRGKSARHRAGTCSWRRCGPHVSYRRNRRLDTLDRVPHHALEDDAVQPAVYTRMTPADHTRPPAAGHPRKPPTELRPARPTDKRPPHNGRRHERSCRIARTPRTCCVICTFSGSPCVPISGISR